MVVLHTDFIVVDGEPAWPAAYVNREGVQVLPKPKLQPRYAHISEVGTWPETPIPEDLAKFIHEDGKAEPVPAETMDVAPSSAGDITMDKLERAYADSIATPETAIMDLTPPEEPKDWTCSHCRVLVPRSHIVKVFMEAGKAGTCTWTTPAKSEEITDDDIPF